MEERRPPTADEDDDGDDRRRLSPSPDDEEDQRRRRRDASVETYVVQIPKDQIYRVPPPEHARIVEEYSHRKSSQQNKTRRKSLCFGVIPAALLLLVAALIAVLAVRATVYDPRPPNFTLTSVRATRIHPGKKPQLDITINAKNPNPRMSISYKSGKSALIFKNKQIGQGSFPLSPAETAPNAATVFHLSLSRNDVVSPAAAAERSMKLNLSIPMEISSWIRTQKMTLKISCDFTLKNPFTAPNQKITKQKCSPQP
ncbi:hypothetical protein M569_14673 [Genlisea aurea]|uniref:Late embryogenesis abundant protein LEA-2 subgroup domain-containing protein n=1 Tax=Genlisea aurea TaxID=192259 RepID=S8DKT6_9LAMI|nr:hypothetical protein M569_14673 [Genlisea aurea]